MPSQDIFSRMSSAYNTVANATHPDLMTRYMGGHNRTNHPYVSGYWQLFINVPAVIFPTDSYPAETWLHATAEGFTPPSRTINKVDLPGQGGLGSSFITGQSLTRTFTVTFREYQNLPISQTLSRWTAIIDPYIGVSPVSGTQWLPQSYKGNAYIIQTKPVGAGMVDFNKEMIEKVYLFHGVFPEGDGGDAFASDIATNDFAQLSISFSFDGWPLTGSVNPAIVDKAVEMLANISAKYSDTYDNYANTAPVIAP
jgi:hypothetical protein